MQNKRRLAFTEWGIIADNSKAKLEYFKSIGFEGVSFLNRFLTSEDSLDPELLDFIRINNTTVIVHSAFGMDTSAVGAIDYIREQIVAIKRWVEKTGIGIEMVNFDPGVNKNGFDLAETAKGINYAYSELNPLNIKVGFENWVVNAKLEILYEIHKQMVSKDIGMLLDLGHLNIVKTDILTDGMTFADYVKQIPFNIYELHIHDNNGKEDQHLPLGYGNAPVEELIDAVEQKGFDGFMTLEIVGGDLSSEEWQKKLVQSRNIMAGE